MNYAHIIGRLAKDPETRFTSGGQKVTVLIVATDSYRSGNDETIWWRVTLWGDRWDKMMPYLTKGKPIMIGGELRKPEVYTDKSGTPQVGSIELTADYVKFVPFGRPAEGEAGGQGYSGAQQPQQQAQQPQQFQDSNFGGGNQFGAEQGAAVGGQGQDFGQGGSDEEPLPF